MKFLHYEINADEGATVRVALRGSECNVLLMDDHNFFSYRRGGSYRYVGGHYKRSPVLLSVPEAGHWNVVIDTGGYAGSLEASVTVL